MEEELICSVCGNTVYYNANHELRHVYGYLGRDHDAVLREAVPFPAGSKAVTGSGTKVTVLAADKGVRWCLEDAGSQPFNYLASKLRPIPSRIAKPEIGQVVWDGEVPWLMGSFDVLLAWVDGVYRALHWNQMPDTVTLAVPPVQQP